MPLKITFFHLLCCSNAIAMLPKIHINMTITVDVVLYFYSVLIAAREIGTYGSK